MLARHQPTVVAIAALACVSLACSDENEMPDLRRADAGSPEIRAEAQVKPTRGHRANGTVSFSWSGDGTTIVADFASLPPGKHAFHVHEYGDCSAPDASSAGDHFALVDPASPPEKILGNLGELDPAPDGRANLSAYRSEARLAGPRSILGRTVVVHSRGNDATHPPDGNAGDRIACGVIRRTN